MSLPLQVNVGPLYVSDGVSPGSVRTDRTSALVVAEAGGKYGEGTARGQLFTYSTPAAGVAIPIYSSTTQQCVLYNPANNNKAFYIRRITFGYVSGTMVAGHFCLATQTLATNAITGTQSALVQNNKVYGNYNASGQNGGTLQLFTAATVVAFTYFRPLSLSQVAQTAAGTNAPWVYSEDIDESIVLMPGGAIAVAANAAAFVTATVGIEGREVPVALAS